MIQNPITFVVSNNGTILGGQRGTIRALSNYASKIYLVAPFESVSVKANYLIYESKREVISQYLAPTTLKGSDVLADNDPQYQTAGEWSVWEASISQRALHRIAKYRSGRIGVSFEVTSITQPSQALTYKGLFGKTQNDTLPSENNVLGDFYVCDTYNFISNGITFTKGDYAYWNGSAWLKGQNIQQIAMTSTQDLAVDPSLQAEIPADISEDAELEALIDQLISDVGDLSTDLTAHVSDLDDPHDTQANQVDGTYRSQASDVQASLNTIANELDGITDGETDITYDPSADDIITSTTVAGALGQLDFTTHTHITDQTNPHNVVASQVNVSHQGSTVSVQTAITDLQNDKVEKDAPIITSITGTNKVYVNDGSDKLITVANLRTYIVDELVSFAYQKFTEKDENGQPVITSPQTNKIYIYDDPNSEIANDIYEEWIYVQEDDTYEQIGTTQVQLSDYYTKSEANTLLDGKSDTNHLHDDRYYQESEVDALIQVAKQIHYYPNTKNDSGLLIPKGTVVQFAGSQGDFIKIKSAVPSEIETNPELLMGLAENDIANDAFGNVVWFGQVKDMLVNPDNLNNGNVLYFDYNTGGLTTTAPSENKIIVAAVEKVSSTNTATNGILIVRVKWVSRNIADIDGLQTQLDGYDTHVAAMNNPHEVTAAQVGAYTTAQADTNFEPKNANIQTHISATDNPHGVTASQVGAYTTGETDSAISTAIASLVDTAPDALNTLNELANALGDDANFATTVTNALADKSDVGHTHDDRYYTETELDAGQLDNRYYTEAEVDEKFNDLVFSINDPVDDLNGLTLQEVFGDGNLVDNGDFSNGTTDWQVISGTISVSNNELTLTTDNNQSLAYIYQNKDTITSSKYFSYYEYYVNDTNVIQVYNRLGGSSSDNAYVSDIPPVNNEWIEASAIKTKTSDDNVLRYILDYNINTTVEIKLKNIMLINLTSLGLTALTEAQLNYYLDLYQALKPQQLPETTTHTQTESIKSVPVGTLDGQVSGFEAEGLTLENSVVNGDFSNGTTGWLFTRLSSSLTNQIITLSNTSLTFGYIHQNNLQNIGDIYFAYSKVRNISNTTTLDYGLSDLNTITNPIANQWYEMYAKYEAVETLFLVRGQGTTGFQYEIDGNAGIFLINMTALGIESYTEAQMLDLVRSGYFDGLTSVEQPSITSVGKNLLRELEEGSISFNGGNFVNQGSVRSNFIEIFPNTAYIISSNNALSNVYFNWYDSGYVFISRVSGVSNTSPSNAKYVRIKYDSGLVNDLTQLEQGSSATTYEPYKSSTLALNTPLRSLPNGVRDRVYEQNGEVWLEKRVEEYVLQSADVTAVGTLGNYQYVQFKKPSDFIYATFSGGALATATAMFAEGYVSVSVAQENALIEYSTTRMAFLVELGTYADLAAAQADLVGTLVQYQLATPQLINLTEQGLADGQLTAYANGTVYNTSTTFHPDIQFDVTSNRSAQISALIDNSDYQAKLIDSKASKVQEDWIEPTLLNGWVNVSTTRTSRYYKDDMGVVHIVLNIKDGTATTGTLLFNLPLGYRPTESTKGIGVRFNDGTLSYITISSAGAVEIGVNNGSGSFEFHADFKVGE